MKILTDIQKIIIILEVINKFFSKVTRYKTSIQISVEFLCAEKVKSDMKVLVAQSCLTLRHHGLRPTRLLCLWNSPGKRIGVGSHSLLQGIFPTQGSKLGLLHWRHIFTIWAPREALRTSNLKITLTKWLHLWQHEKDYNS